MYAEAQRRNEDYKEFGAALAALMFNVFQLLRTIMGVVQLNAFVAWCKDAIECTRALLGEDSESSESNQGWRAEISEQGVGSWADSSVRRSVRETRGFYALLQFEVFVVWSKRVMERMRECKGRNAENSDYSSSTDDDNIELSWNIEEKIKVNNMVVDNELGGREVTVLPSWKKMWGGLKKGSFRPSSWLLTDRAMLNTVRWSGSFLCGMGEHWGVEGYVERENAEILAKFFSDEMFVLRDILQWVEWNIDMENGGHEHISISEFPGYRRGKLTGEMSTAYGTGFGSYDFGDPYNVELYSFEFDSLVSSYPANDKKLESGNRESVKVGLAHSMVLAKHLGVEKLKQIRRYYDHYQVPVGCIRGNAFKLLKKQAQCSIPDDFQPSVMFESDGYNIPLFPYRMQAVALWDEATNWRVLQASAHQDICDSLQAGLCFLVENEEKVLHHVPDRVDIFEYCTEWTKQRNLRKDSLGLVIETVRTFLAEWIARSRGEAVWEPEIPKDCFEFGLGQTRTEFELEEDNTLTLLQRRLIWVCQS